MSFPFDVCVPHRHKGGVIPTYDDNLVVQDVARQSPKRGVIFSERVKFRFQRHGSGPFSATFDRLAAQSRDIRQLSATFGRSRARSRKPGACFATFGSPPAQSRKPGPPSATLGGPPAQGRDPGACFATLGSPPAQGRNSPPPFATFGSLSVEQTSVPCSTHKTTCPPGGTYLRPLFHNPNKPCGAHSVR